MKHPEHLQTMELPNGLEISIFDRTKVYFGDYHHVRLKIVCLPSETFRNQPGSRKVYYERTLEKMGVPSREVQAVIGSLLKDFEKNSLPYLSSPEFPQKMVEKIMAQKGPVTRKFIGASS